MQHAEATAVDRRRVLASRKALAAGLDADELHLGVVDEPGEESDRVRSAADAGDGLVGEPPVLFEALPARLAPDDALEVAHHLGGGRGTRHRADHVERVVAVGHPVAERLVHGVLQRCAALGDGVYLRAQELHALDVRRLPVDVQCAHVDLARHPEERGDCRRGDAMHPRARLGDQTALAHALCEERLSNRVVDLVCAGVVEVFAFQEDRRPAKMIREPPRAGERTFPAHIVAQEFLELASERRVRLRRLVGGFQFPERGHERLRHILPAVFSVVCFHAFSL